jgi:hypothetical protein
MHGGRIEIGEQLGIKLLGEITYAYDISGSGQYVDAHHKDIVLLDSGYIFQTGPGFQAVIKRFRVRV